MLGGLVGGAQEWQHFRKIRPSYLDSAELCIVLFPDGNIKYWIKKFLENSVIPPITLYLK